MMVVGVRQQSSSETQSDALRHVDVPRGTCDEVPLGQRRQVQTDWHFQS